MDNTKRQDVDTVAKQLRIRGDLDRKVKIHKKKMELRDNCEYVFADALNELLDKATKRIAS